MDKEVHKYLNRCRFLFLEKLACLDLGGWGGGEMYPANESGLPMVCDYRKQVSDLPNKATISAICRLDWICPIEYQRLHPLPFGLKWYAINN